MRKDLKSGVRVFCPDGVEHLYRDWEDHFEFLHYLCIRGNGALVVERRRYSPNDENPGVFLPAAFAPGEWLRAIEVADE